MSCKLNNNENHIAQRILYIFSFFFLSWNILIENLKKIKNKTQEIENRERSADKRRKNQNNHYYNVIDICFLFVS